MAVGRRMGPGPPDTTARGRVLVIGAQGVLGAFLARAFAEAGWEVVRGGRRPEGASDLCQLDLDAPNTLHQACGDVDLVVSTVPHPGIAAERAVLRGGGALLNVASMTAAERAELEAEQEDARGLVVVHAGLAPGVTTLVAAELLLAHPEADAMEVVMTFSAATAGGRAGAAFGYRLLTGAVHHPTVTVPLPPPFGRRRCLDVGMATEGWLTAVAGARHAPAHLPRGASHRRGVAHPERPAPPLGAAAGGVRRRAAHDSP